MTRYLLTAAVALAAAPAFAILPPLPPVIAPPSPPAAKDDAPKPEDDGDDVAKLADRIGKNAKGVTDKLGDRDTGDATRRDQAKLKQDLDKLIDLLQNPPMSDMPPPMGGDGGNPPPQGGGQNQGQQPMGNQGGKQPMGGTGNSGGKSNQPMPGGQQPMGNQGGQQPMGNKPGQSQRTGSGRRERGQQPMPMPTPGGQQPMPAGPQPTPGGQEPAGAKPDAQGQPMPMGTNTDPMGQPGGNAPGAGGKATPALPLAETIAKDFWGHLPELPRQRMMQFFREQYNSRYKDLLPDYFSTLAEKEKKGKK